MESTADRNDFESVKAKLKVIIDEELSQHREWSRNSIHFKGSDTDATIDEIVDQLADGHSRILLENDENVDSHIPEIRRIISILQPMLSRVTPIHSRIMEGIFYEENVDGVIAPSRSMIELLEDRWPITTQLSYYFQAYQEGEYDSLEEAVDDGIRITLDRIRADHVPEHEVNELLDYYEKGYYKSCYFFAGSYCERIFADLREKDDVSGFKGNVGDIYDEFRDSWGDSLLLGFFEAVKTHWKSFNRSNNRVPELPTRHSIAHGVPAERDVTKKDALQMLLILQAIPYWLDYAEEIREID